MLPLSECDGAAAAVERHADEELDLIIPRGYPLKKTLSYSWEIPEPCYIFSVPQPESKCFQFNDASWSILLATDASNSDSRGRFLGFFLKLKDVLSDDPKSVLPICATFSFTVFRMYDYQVVASSCCYYRFNEVGNDWGFAKLVSADALFKTLGEQPLAPTSPGNQTEAFAVLARIRVYDDITGVLFMNPEDMQRARYITGYAGLRNQGATCYMNSILQSLFFTNAFRRAVYQIPVEPSSPSTSTAGSAALALTSCQRRSTSRPSQQQPKSLTYALQRLFYSMQTRCVPAETNELTASFGWNTVDAFAQHDVQEFLRVIMDRIEEKMKGTAAEGTMQKLFVGKMCSYIKCVDVKFESAREEDFYDIQLTIRGMKDVRESFRNYVKEEVLDGDNKYDAEGFGLQRALKGVKFTKFPPVLYLHLNRFDFDYQYQTMVKINDRYEFSLVLDLDEFLAAPPSVNESPNHTSTESKPDTRKVFENSNNVTITRSAEIQNLLNLESGATSDNSTSEHLGHKHAAPKDPFCKAATSDGSRAECSENGSKTTVRQRYHLHGILVHSGIAEGGHYIAFIRPTVENRWVRFNDDNVTPVTDAEAVEDNFGGVLNGLAKPAAQITHQDNDQGQNPDRIFGIKEDHQHLNPGLGGMGINSNLANRQPMQYSRVSSAYMLVYIRESERSEILAKIDDNDIPFELRKLLRGSLHEQEFNSAVMYDRENYFWGCVYDERDMQSYSGPNLFKAIFPIEEKVSQFKARMEDEFQEVKSSSNNRKQSPPTSFLGIDLNPTRHNVVKLDKRTATIKSLKLACAHRYNVSPSKIVLWPLKLCDDKSLRPKHKSLGRVSDSTFLGEIWNKFLNTIHVFCEIRSDCALRVISSLSDNNSSVDFNELTYPPRLPSSPIKATGEFSPLDLPESLRCISNYSQFVGGRHDLQVAAAKSQYSMPTERRPSVTKYINFSDPRAEYTHDSLAYMREFGAVATLFVKLFDPVTKTLTCKGYIYMTTRDMEELQSRVWDLLCLKWGTPLELWEETSVPSLDKIDPDDQVEVVDGMIIVAQVVEENNYDKESSSCLNAGEFYDWMTNVVTLVLTPTSSSPIVRLSPEISTSSLSNQETTLSDENSPSKCFAPSLAAPGHTKDSSDDEHKHSREVTLTVSLLDKYVNVCKLAAEQMGMTGPLRLQIVPKRQLNTDASVRSGTRSYNLRTPGIAYLPQSCVLPPLDADLKDFVGCNPRENSVINMEYEILDVPLLELADAISFQIQVLVAGSFAHASNVKVVVPKGAKFADVKRVALEKLQLAESIDQARLLLSCESFIVCDIPDSWPVDSLSRTDCGVFILQCDAVPKEKNVFLNDIVTEQQQRELFVDVLFYDGESNTIHGTPFRFPLKPQEPFGETCARLSAVTGLHISECTPEKCARMTRAIKNQPVIDLASIRLVEKQPQTNEVLFDTVAQIENAYSTYKLSDLLAAVCGVDEQPVGFTKVPPFVRGINQRSITPVSSPQADDISHRLQRRISWSEADGASLSDIDSARTSLEAPPPYFALTEAEEAATEHGISSVMHLGIMRKTQKSPPRGNMRGSSKSIRIV